jgi:mRNA deadenylase 3'-5' endonuclease subunit Ccr4
MDHGDSIHPAALEKTLEFIPHIPQLRSCYSHYARNHKKRKNLQDSPVIEMEQKPKVHGEPPFTTYTVEWKGTLDYIFLWGDSLRVQGILDLPDPSAMEPGIPNEIFPSDHIPLIANLSLGEAK